MDSPLLGLYGPHPWSFGQWVLHNDGTNTGYSSSTDPDYTQYPAGWGTPSHERTKENMTRVKYVIQTVKFLGNQYRDGQDFSELMTANETCNEFGSVLGLASKAPLCYSPIPRYRYIMKYRTSLQNRQSHRFELK